MGYDEKLAERIRAILSGRKDVVEKKMFGGVAFMVGGRMACGPQQDNLIVRIGQQAAFEHIGRAHVKPMDFTGRVMRAFAMIEAAGLRTEPQLRKWVLMAAEFAAADQSPRKAPKWAKARRGAPAARVASDRQKSPGRGTSRKGGAE